MKLPKVPSIERFVLSKIPAVLRPLAQAILGPPLAAVDVVLQTLSGNVAHILAEPQVVISTVVAAVNAATVHTLFGYLTAIGIALSRLLTSPGTALGANARIATRGPDSTQH